MLGLGVRAGAPCWGTQTLPEAALAPHVCLKQPRNRSRSLHPHGHAVGSWGRGELLPDTPSLLPWVSTHSSCAGVEVGMPGTCLFLPPSGCTRAAPGCSTVGRRDAVPRGRGQEHTESPSPWGKLVVPQAALPAPVSCLPWPGAASPAPPCCWWAGGPAAWPPPAQRPCCGCSCREFLRAINQFATTLTEMFLSSSSFELQVRGHHPHPRRGLQGACPACGAAASRPSSPCATPPGTCPHFHCSFGTTISTWPWLSSPRTPCSWRTSPRPSAPASWPSESLLPPPARALPLGLRLQPQPAAVLCRQGFGDEPLRLCMASWPGR